VIVPTGLSSAAMQGIERFGAGSWGAIRAALLPEWPEQAVRAHATRLLSTADLGRYQGQRGSRCHFASILLRWRQIVWDSWTAQQRGFDFMGTVACLSCCAAAICRC